MVSAISLTASSASAQISSSGTVQSDTLPKNTIVATIPVGTQPYGIVVVSDNYLWVAAIDVASGALKKAVLTVPVADVIADDELGQLAITPNGKYVYVADYSASSVVMLSASGKQRVGQPILAGQGAYYVAVAPNGKNLYVSNNNGNSVTVVDIAP